MDGFLEALRIQRWDDHRYYHHSRINQTLHLISALSFVCAYALVFTDPVAAALIGWLVAMTSRQAGHFFFEPKDYDEINQATHEYKEEIKVGYNLQRKVVLMGLWAASPLLLYLDPTLLGLTHPHAGATDYLRTLGWLWIALGVGALAWRAIQLAFTRGVETAMAWILKIVTDPLHDIKLYYKAPLYLLRGELIDPGRATRAA